jgi:hypothetical protein
VGHSTDFTVSVDGDGSANLKIEKVDGKLLDPTEKDIELDDKGQKLHFGFGE